MYANGREWRGQSFDDGLPAASRTAGASDRRNRTALPTISGRVAPRRPVSRPARAPIRAWKSLISLSSCPPCGGFDSRSLPLPGDPRYREITPISPKRVPVRANRSRGRHHEDNRPCRPRPPATMPSAWSAPIAVPLSIWRSLAVGRRPTRNSDPRRSLHLASGALFRRATRPGQPCSSRANSLKKSTIAENGSSGTTLECQ
jgi:hypothetical protein